MLFMSGTVESGKSNLEINIHRAQGLTFNHNMTFLRWLSTTVISSIQYITVSDLKSKNNTVNNWVVLKHTRSLSVSQRYLSVPVNTSQYIMLRQNKDVLVPTCLWGMAHCFCSRWGVAVFLIAQSFVLKKHLFHYSVPWNSTVFTFNQWVFAIL